MMRISYNLFLENQLECLGEQRREEFKAPFFSKRDSALIGILLGRLLIVRQRAT